MCLRKQVLPQTSSSNSQGGFPIPYAMILFGNWVIPSRGNQILDIYKFLRQNKILSMAK